jgi:hypothetical protein
MELYEARDHYIIQDGNNTLWCNRFDGAMFAGTGMFWSSITCHFHVCAFMKMSMHDDFDFNFHHDHDPFHIHVIDLHAVPLN